MTQKSDLAGAAKEVGNLTPNPFPSGKGNRIMIGEPDSYSREQSSDAARDFAIDTFHWVQGSPLPKEV